MLPILVIILFFLTGITIYVVANSNETGLPQSATVPPQSDRTATGTASPPTGSLPRVSTNHSNLRPILPPKSVQMGKNNSVLLPNSPLLQNDGMYSIHFIHIPKCGGTSMTAVLREMMCSIDSIKNQDCCTNPGFCDFGAGRRCAVIKGCINHFPNRPFIYKNMPTVTIMREPVSRLVSAWFYRGHNPNNDFFQVRPEFKEIKFGQRPKVEFSDYLEMIEYNNIQTRMLGSDSFPYRNIVITQEIYDKAVDALNHIFFVGLQDAYELSVEVMLRELGLTINIPVKREREQVSKSQQIKKSEILSNDLFMKRAKEVNQYDTMLYELAKKRFCSTVKKYPDLSVKLLETKVRCN